MADVEGLVQGLHHITLVTSNQEVNRKFYTEILGLRRVKLTVNQDDIYHRHLFYADEKGTTGSAITFFEWPDLPRGVVGLGSPHHLAYTVGAIDALPKWKSWLLSNGLSVQGPLARDGRVSLYLRDPDGVTVEIASPNSDSLTPGDLAELERNLPSVSGITPDMKLIRFNHASPVTSDSSLTVKFLDKFVGLKESGISENPDQKGTSILSVGSGETNPDFLRYIYSEKARSGFVGRGNIHHIAMAVEDDQDQLKIMRRLNDAGMRNSGIVDRFWFKSLYFRDPDENLLEIATKGPGYAVDEKPEELGSRLVLPRWLEPKRQNIETALKETDGRNEGTWPPEYPSLHKDPESILVGDSNA